MNAGEIVILAGVIALVMSVAVWGLIRDQRRKKERDGD